MGLPARVSWQVRLCGYFLIWTWPCSSIWRRESSGFAHGSAVCHFVVELLGVDNFGLHCYRSVFSEGVSIKQHVELAWREDSQAVGWIRCEGVCSGTDSTWSFSSVWIYIYYIKKGISCMELNWLCQRVWICWHISRCCITLLSYCVSSGLGASDCEIKPDVLVCSFFFLSLRRLRDCPTLFSSSYSPGFWLTSPVSR